MPISPKKKKNTPAPNAGFDVDAQERALAKASKSRTSDDAKILEVAPAKPEVPKKGRPAKAKKEAGQEKTYRYTLDVPMELAEKINAAAKSNYTTKRGFWLMMANKYFEDE